MAVVFSELGRGLEVWLGLVILSRFKTILSRDETAWCCDETAERGGERCVCLSVLRARDVCACPCFVRSVVCVVWCVF